MEDKNIQKYKEIYLASDLDSEDYEDNLKLVTEWETSLRQNEDFANWQASDVTKAIVKQARDTYRELAMRLVLDRTLTDTQRNSIWSKQDAALWLLSLIEKDVKSAIAQIHSEIRRAINVQ